LFASGSKQVPCCQTNFGLHENATLFEPVAIKKLKYAIFGIPLED